MRSILDFSKCLSLSAFIQVLDFQPDHQSNQMNLYYIRSLSNIHLRVSQQTVPHFISYTLQKSQNNSHKSNDLARPYLGLDP